MKELLSGNEALARGALEAGIEIACGYPGTPSSEILENVAKYKEIYSEWSVNEKVAMDAAAGAAYSGRRSMVTTKQVGMNVLSDSLFYTAYTGAEAALVVITADDPGLFSSQNEQVTNGMGSNVTIDAVCLPQTFEQAVEITSVAGRVMSLGFTTEPSKIAQLSITLKELDIRGSRHQTFKFAHVVQLFNEGKLKADKLVSNIFDFKDINKALDLIENKPSEICKIVLTFNS